MKKRAGEKVWTVFRQVSPNVTFPLAALRSDALGLRSRRSCSGE